LHGYIFIQNFPAMKRILFSLGLVIISLFAFSNQKQRHNPESESKTKLMIQDTLPVKVQLEQTTMRDCLCCLSLTQQQQMKQ